MLKKKQVFDIARGTLFVNGMKMTGVAIEETATDIDGHADDKGYHCSASFSVSSSDEGVQKLMHSKVMQPERNRAQRRKELHEQLKKSQRFTKRLRLAQKQRCIKE